jgi:hypothetical protein
VPDIVVVEKSEAAETYCVTSRYCSPIVRETLSIVVYGSVWVRL